MAKKISILIIVSFLVSLSSAKINAQENSPLDADSLLDVYRKKWIDLGTEGKLDSAIYYAKKTQAYVETNYGTLSLKNAIALANMMGFNYYLVGDNTTATYFYKKGIKAFEFITPFYNTHNNRTDFSTYEEQYATALCNFGIINGGLGATLYATDLLKKALPLWRKHTDWSGLYAQCIINLAICYSHSGEYYKARLLYDTLKQYIDTLPKKGDFNFNQICYYNNMADIYSQTGNPKKALEYTKKADNIFAATNIQNNNNYFHFDDYLTILVNVAEGYKSMHYYDSALLKCQQAKDSLLTKKDAFSQANILQEQAGIYIEEKKFTKALQLCNESLLVMDTLLPKPDFYCATLLHLGGLYLHIGKYISADSVYQIEINYLYGKRLTSSYYLQQSLMAMCQSLLYQNKNKQAADSLLKAGNLAMHVLTENFVGMPESDQVQYTGVFDGIFDMLNALLAKDKNISTAVKRLAFELQLQRKNLVLANQTGLLSRLRNTNDTAIANLYSTWLNTKQMLAKQYSLPYSDRNLNTDSLEELSENLEKRVSVKGYNSGFTNKADITNTFLLQNKSTANIQFVRYNKTGKNKNATNAEYGAFIIHGGDAIPSFVHLCSEASLINLVQTKNWQIQNEAQLTQKLYSPSALEAVTLYALIWHPLDKYLQGVSAINYSPAGLLNNIAFHALYNGKNWLSNKYTIHCFSSLADVSSVQITAEPKQISLWGNMDYDSSSYSIDTARSNSEGETNTGAMYAYGIKPAQQSKSISKSPLPNFYTDELSAIKKIFAANNISYTGYENTTATEENFKQHSPNIQGVLHISTHGFYTPYNKKDADAQLPGSFIAGNTNPLFRCGLAFAGVNYYWMKGQPKPNHDDGILTGYEVSQLDLHNVRLVTLSACETGLGDITATEGNLGLQRAFKLAGVQKLLVSLWQVPAKQTQQLLTKFYTYWLAGSTPAQALQTAETDMQKAHYPPYYWAGFVLVE